MLFWEIIHHADTHFLPVRCRKFFDGTAVKFRAFAPALPHRPHAGRTGPGLVVHWALIFADPADTVSKFQFFRVDKISKIQGKILEFFQK